MGEYARNTQEPARNTQEYASENTYSAEYVFCAGISLVLVWLARVLREEHFSAFLHVVYSVCILCVFLRIQCILLYSGAELRSLKIRLKNIGIHEENTTEERYRDGYDGTRRTHEEDMERCTADDHTTAKENGNEPHLAACTMIAVCSH